MTEPNAETMRAAPAVAPPPARTRSGSDLLRLLPYIFPYRVRWIAMLSVAVLSLVATISIPLMTKAVIDGPVRHQDQQGLWVLGIAAMGIGIVEAVLWFLRRWLIARGTMGVEADIRKDLYARLQILPMSFHGRWQSGQLLSRIMNDLSSIRRFMSFGMVFLLLNTLQIIAVTAILLAMYWPLGVIVVVSIVPVTLTVLHFQREYTRLSRLAQDQSGHVATHVEESALGVRVIKSFGRERYAYDRFDRQLTDLYDTQVKRVSMSAKFWTLLEIIPNLTLIIVLGLGAYAAGEGYVTMGTLVAFITMMLSLVWPIASLGFLLSMMQESFTAANRIAEIFDAPREIEDGPVSRGAAGRQARTRRRRLPVPRSRSRRLGVTARQPRGRTWGDGRTRRPDRIGKVGDGRAAVAPLRRHRGCDPHRRQPTFATCRCPRCGRRSPPRSRTRRCSRCRSQRISGSADRTRPRTSWRRPSRSRPRSSSTTCRSASTPGSANRA